MNNGSLPYTCTCTFTYLEGTLEMELNNNNQEVEEAVYLNNKDSKCYKKQ